MNSLLTLTTQSIPLPPPDEHVWYVLKLRTPALLEITPYDIDALRRRLEARRRITGGKGA